ncbi:craniofacial development protein 1 isoform X6 [Apteryx rowi]|uniref:craniofacial development protein 1 isoform X6 n=1 Tax=Apteryx rowi TaxID=308060 RepID=UPI000E1CA85F|nr:craniofacial development protein 1 isoform X6 [Apteryx rowi]
MSASEEYSSGEDEDYVPSGAEYSEDDASELVAEEEEEEAAAASPRPARGRRSPRRAAGRKRKKGGLLLESGEKEEEKAQQNNEEEEVDNLKQAERDREEEEKKKEDALWASFLSDVGQKPKVLTATQVTQTSKAEEKSVNKLQEKSKEPEKPKDAGKLTITEVFDFAGEEVRVKRPSGMSSLLGKITSKKQKMSTLEKSKLDWENFKEEEGIGEELAIHNRGKDGYIERKAFLERVDHRQFEIERDIRLSRMKP